MKLEMTIAERIKLLRKEILKLSQEAFGEELGVKRDVINNIEGNRLKRPEQKEPLYKLICQKFKVSYDWLMTGEGDMFENLPETVLEELAMQYELDEMDKSIIRSYLDLTASERETVKKYIRGVLGK